MNNKIQIINRPFFSASRWAILAGLTAFLTFVSLSCKEAKDEGQLTVLGSDGGYTYFKGDLNMNIMSDCGKATVATSQTGGGSNSSN
ncbi:MAG: hypothetical protein H3C43_09580, partial [Leptonema sp. (in: Bacteria)]|nr:hypothetical protein [Leptonema sp. (in: bacteria)]